MDPNATAPQSPTAPIQQQPATPISQPPTPPLPQPSPSDIYPTLIIPHIQNPNRLYAFPILGFIVKAVILIPVSLWIMIVILVVLAETIINSFIVLFTGKYWPAAYRMTIGFMRLSTRTYAFWFGLTDKYPGFSLQNSEDVILEMSLPENPKRLYAIPLIGGLIRMILMIPYGIYTTVISYGSYIGVVVSFIPVLFSGRYPESTYELAYDGIRLTQSSYAYTFGISDKYPSFSISWNHKIIKIILVTLGALLFLFNSINSFSNEKEKTAPATPTFYQNPLPTSNAF